MVLLWGDTPAAMVPVVVSTVQMLASEVHMISSAPVNCPEEVDTEKSVDSPVIREYACADNGAPAHISKHIAAARHHRRNACTQIHTPESAHRARMQPHLPFTTSWMLGMYAYIVVVAWPSW